MWSAKRCGVSVGYEFIRLSCIGQDNKTGDFMKRTVFLTLALFALMAVGVYAQTEADFVVSKSKDGKSITIDEYKGKTKTVNIPAKIQNLPVTIIGDSAFLGDKNITSVTIPNGVLSIRGRAFESCTGLTSVSIPNSVLDIGGMAFSGCTGLTSVSIPNSVQSIGDTAFSGCNKLTSITIPTSVTIIGSGAFSGCTSLTSVTFGGSIPASEFNANAFRNLGDIRDKYLAAAGGAGTYTRPSGGTTWTKGASATVAPAADGTKGLKFTLTSDGKSYIVNARGEDLIGDVVIPATYNNLPVTRIGQMAFSDAKSLSSVTIPASVTEIQIGAFVNCALLKSVTFGGANTVFYDNAFPDGDLSQKYKAGKAGTYTRPDANSKTWTKK
jgi:hypothetical protein